MRRFLPDATTLAAGAAGGLLALAFPRPDLDWLAWGALVPLLLVMHRRPFRSGFTAGLVFFAAILYWVNIVMTTYGKMHPLFSVIAWLLLSAYLALFFAAATWTACRLKESCGYAYSLTLPVVWVALEFLREFLLTGFPWASIGYSQHDSARLLQSADLFGVYGLGYLLVLVNAVAAEWLLARRRPRGRRPLAAAAVAAVLLAAAWGYGQWRLGGDPDRRDDRLKIAVVQGNIPQDVKWLPEFQQETVAIYRDLSLRAAREAQPGLIIWPEAATPFFYQEGGKLAAEVTKLPQEAGAALLFGSPAYRKEPGGVRYLNSAYLLDADGREKGRSDKIHLVPFGEYVPLKRFLPFIDKIVVGIGDFSPGTINPLPLDGHKLGVLVCYEAIFPELAREWVRQGSGLLVNITNDAWFGNSSAPWQHLAMVRFRAVENRVWVARAANTGISAFIAPSGRLHAATGLFVPAAATVEVGLGARPGLYARMGDLIPALFVAISVLWLVQTRKKLR
ncbi:MAG: apolipoprotein N-acyltransferase [Deltaproteobacteria bacterium]|nr:MAG: apolipoprotein N-acyltransferase [Deltaproteobacteria bacterium]